jgi:hypothetical protein
MITETVREPDKTVNAHSEPQNEAELKAILRAANTSWLRYPMLILTLLSLAVVVIKARQLTEGILAAVEPLVELFNLPW